MPLTLEHIKWAYRLFLDREPDEDFIIAPHIDACKNTEELRVHIANSEEYLKNNPDLTQLTYPGQRKRLSVESELTADELATLFKRVESTWESFGDSDPHWSVMSAEKFRKSNISDAREAFYQSGEIDANILKHTLARNGLKLEDYKTCIEIGCGVGRITSWLADFFHKIYAYDISGKHIEIAEGRFEEVGIDNVEFSKFDSINRIANLPKVDCVFTIIVLQHNPPPVIAFMIEHLLASLNPGGIALFQVPTYLKDYSFESQSYLQTPSDGEILEMHILPQCDVFRIAQKSACSIVEVLEDDCIGRHPGSTSNTFLFKKNAE